MKSLFFILPLFLVGNAYSQIPFEDIFEDQQEMADAFYGTFKVQGKLYTGKAIAYHDNGKIKTLRAFKDGKYHGMWTEWYPNGNRKFEGNRIKNKGDGLTRWWYENGQLKKQGTYDMDKQQGVVVHWYPNGNLKRIRYYEQDQPTGGWTTFDEAGEVQDEGDDHNLFYRPFFGNDVAPDGFEETSPSFTTDGQTMVFARYMDWVKKVPYIAYLKNNKWYKEQLPFVDTLYNLAISPNGNRIVYKTFDEKNGAEISRTFIVDKMEKGWGVPKEVRHLYNINAGYFHFTPDGTLFYFARSPKTGIYYSLPDEKNEYTPPIWLSDQVGLKNSDSFDVFLNPEKDKLIISQAYSQKKYPERGKIGLYYYEKIKGEWIRIKKLPIAYGWGPSITPDKKFVFVRNGNIQFIPLENLDIPW